MTLSAIRLDSKAFQALVIADSANTDFPHDNGVRSGLSNSGDLRTLRLQL